eukprot:1148124-Pelagomonas_calceolata.AAC.1
MANHALPPVVRLSAEQTITCFVSSVIPSGERHNYIKRLLKVAEHHAGRAHASSLDEAPTEGEGAINGMPCTTALSVALASLQGWLDSGQVLNQTFCEVVLGYADLKA